jgi:hypothetical protein
MAIVLCQSGSVARPTSSPADPGHLATRPRPDDPRHRDAARSFAAGDDRDWANRFVWVDRTNGRPPTNPVGDRPPSRQRGAGVGDFVRRLGWRAYALPILTVITIVTLTSEVGQGHRHPASPGVGASSSSSGTGGATSAPSGTSRVKVDTGSGADVLPGDALPPGPAYTTQGKGTFTILKGIANPVGHGRLVTYAIEVEDGMTGVDTGAFQRLVVGTLSDPRSWTGSGKLALQRVDSPDADVRIALTSSMTVRQICGYDQKIETSCHQEWHGLNQVTLNVARWVRGDVQFGQDLTAYRHYMINHEFGHALGHTHSFVCLPNGLAPVMMQQTITLRENRGAGPKICQPNSWPYPPGVPKKDAVTT